MTYQVLARKWRPKFFSQVCGQDSIVRVLRNAVLKKKMAHAYIFSGTRGVGKTTLARIFAKALRCLDLNELGDPCGLCLECTSIDSDSSLNVFEIDGASHNGVEDVREIIENVNFVPTSGDYKIYIIDEVHMLSTSAFNALLKTLEEPPAHAVFILATTEGEKIPKTIASRCQKLDFQNASISSSIELLKDLSKKEGIIFEVPSLIEELSAQGKGSFRDTLSLLDQVLCYSSDGIVTEQILYEALGLPQKRVVARIKKAMLNGEIEELKKAYESLSASYVSVESLAVSLLNALYEEIKENSRATAEQLWIYETLMKDCSWALKSIIPEQAFHVVLQKVASRRQFFNLNLEEAKSEQGESLVAPSLPAAPPAPTNEDIRPLTPRSWEDFLKHLFQVSPASAANLEQGNIIAPISEQNGTICFSLGFSGAEKVFFDYLVDQEVLSRLKERLAHFYSFPVERVDIKIELLSEGQVEAMNFKSIASLRKNDQEREMKVREEKLLNSPIILEAQRIFNSKVDKVILN